MRFGRREEVSKQGFILPDIPMGLVEVVDLIKHGSHISGYMEAPGDLIVSREAVGHTGFVLSRFHSIHSIVKTSHPEGENAFDHSEERRRREQEGLIGVVIHQKRPGFLEFDLAGFDNQPLPFDQLQEVVRHYIELGYRGTLHYQFGYVRRDEYWVSHARAEFWFGGIRKYPPDPGKAYLLGLSWNDDQGKEWAKPAFEFCRDNFEASQ
ncbi:MAG: hypothetical protein KW793_04365 [Candidatus Doudnabacteria bacterium]|nr:hypothetical protein [Candidatus Doudnabacteria bacterium]